MILEIVAAVVVVFAVFVLSLNSKHLPNHDDDSQ